MVVHVHLLVHETAQDGTIEQPLYRPVEALSGLPEFHGIYYRHMYTYSNMHVFHIHLRMVIIA